MSEIVDLNAARKRRQKPAPCWITEDNFDGSPWPPDGNDDWRMVYRACGYTLWRRISPPSATRNAAGRAFNPAAQQQTKDQQS